MNSKRVLIFGGTTEGRELAESLCGRGIHCTVCVATEYGEQIMEEMEALTLHKGRMDAEQMKEFIREGEFLAVVDATHPFAAEVSKNIKTGLADFAVPYIRLKRNTDIAGRAQHGIRWFSDTKDCMEALRETEGNILLTTGSKELSVFCIEGLRHRLYVRVLPSTESIALCERQGIFGKQIIAMQGPFSAEMNEVLIRQFDIACLVTKESGAAGGFSEKLKAADNTGIPVMVIGNPEKEEPGYSFEEAVREIYRLLGEPIRLPEISISLIGTGMGAERFLTLEAKEEIERASVVFGAGRLIKTINEKKEKYPYYLAEDIIPQLKSMNKSRKVYGPAIKAAVLFSGDTGFYSGAQKLYTELEKAIEEKKLDAKVRIIPGISSMSYLAAKAGIGWNDAAVVSIHGRKADILDSVMHAGKTFVLVSGLEDMKYLGGLFCGAGMRDLVITAGYRLSYPEEEIMTLTPPMCMNLHKEGLYCCFIENKKNREKKEKEENSGAANKKLTHGSKDSAFIRGKTPMTKEEVRDISICKLGLTREAILYDVGSGTGSIAAECARLSGGLQIYAIEKEAEAAALIYKNCQRFGLSNVTVIEGQAPEALLELPSPTHAFIGGSGGRLRDILKALYEKNPVLKVVINAVTLETAGTVTEFLKEFPVEEEEIVQVQISRSKKAGSYHLMQAENPVYIISFIFSGTGGSFGK